MIILGIGNLHHDPAACLLVDGKLVAASEEERFSRNKHAFGEYPLNAIRFCLEKAGLKPEDVQAAAHPSSPEAYDRHKWNYLRRSLFSRPSQALKAVIKADSRKKNFLETPRKVLKAAGFREDLPLHAIEHHAAHAASAFYFSGFPDAAFLTMDGSGEFTATMLGAFDRQGKMRMIREFIVPDSLGFFYATMTDYLGFEHDDGEYKVMGMAPYGDPSRFSVDDFIRYENKKYRVNDRYIYAVRRQRYQQDKWFSKAMVDRYGKPREGDALSEPYIHIAAATQKKLEDITLQLIDDYLGEALEASGGRLCFAGGCALNVKLNQRLIAHPAVKELWVQPASSDAGLPLGAAAMIAHGAGDKIEPMRHAYYGPEYSDAEIEAVLKKTSYPFRRETSITETASKLLHEGHIVGWFQGRMEWGPRALGNRSILGNPTVKGTADRINEIIKFRENWRPFCPSVLEECGREVLETEHDSPFMTFCFNVRENWKARVPEIVHVDGTARPQYVSREHNARFHELITRFREKSGVPLVINTSLNRRGEPMICSPEDALKMFEGSGLPYMAIGNFLVSKQAI
ncbi:MAG: carbamoyltransferase [Candidatus Omnitrophica bacterium]|nr:carbamoyltransferase [Candidatus Omnitrophota bacterium]